MEKTFQLSRANKDLLQDNEYDVQVCFILDSVVNDFIDKFWSLVEDLL